MTTSNAEAPARPEIPRLLTARQVADLLNCSIHHVGRLAPRGPMPRPLRSGALVRWNRADLMDWLEDGCEPIRSAKGSAQ